MLTLLLTLLTLGQAEIQCTGNITNALNDASHMVGVVKLSPGYCTSDPIFNDKPLRIEGSGEPFTKLTLQKGGFASHAYLNISNMTLQRADQYTDTALYGIDAAGDTIVEHVRIEGFTVGLQVYACHRETLPGWRGLGTNSNGPVIVDVTVVGSAHTGIIIRGCDANVGFYAAIKVYTSCEHTPPMTEPPQNVPAYIAALGECWGIDSRSFFGSGWYSVIVSTTLNGWRPIGSHGASQHDSWVQVSDKAYVDPVNQDTWIQTYRESDQPNPQGDQGTISIGGLSSPWDCQTGPNMGGRCPQRLDGTSIAGASFDNVRDPNNRTLTRFGNQTSGGGFVDYISYNIDKSRSLSLQAVKVGLVYEYMWRIANQTKVSSTKQSGAVTYYQPVTIPPPK